MAMTCSSRRRGRAWLGVAVVAWAALGGCRAQKPLPTTHPVQGRVVVQGGGSLAGGVVQFQSVTDPRLLINGEIGADGTFALTTYVDDRKVAGAVAGEYRVTIVPPIPPDQSVEPIILPQRYTVKEGDNFFEIAVSRPRR